MTGFRDRIVTYFDEFLVTMGTKFGYTSFMKVVFPVSSLYKNLNHTI